MVGPKETNSKAYGASAFNWARAGCSWCHPGGGPLEYDRQGYRYDDPNAFPDGNPATHPDAIEDGGTYATKQDYADAYKGDYYVFTSTGLVSALTGTITDASSQYTRKSWQDGGVVEVDCMMCHFGDRFNTQGRNIGSVGPGGKFAATLGLADDADNTMGHDNELARIPDVGDPSTMTSHGVSPTPTWSWLGTAGVDVTIPADMIRTEPLKENCAACHFADKSFMTKGPSSDMTFVCSNDMTTACVNTSAFDPATTCGDSGATCVNADTGTPLGYTAFQKRSAMTDYDNNPAGTKVMSFHKGRVELGKRSEVLNQAGLDVHMSKDAANTGMGKGMQCSFCHYNVSGNFDPIVDSEGNTVYPGLSVGKMDHQFAKGHNLPDGKNNDQLDNTVTCESCHITKTHPNAGSAVVPSHAGIPSFHMDVIDCRTCHIPVAAGFKKKLAADFSTTQYPVNGIERAQGVKAAKDLGGTFYKTITAKDGSTVKGYKPLKVWQPTRYDRKDNQIVPVGTIVGLQWYDLDETYYPKRFPKKAALAYQKFVKCGSLAYSDPSNPACAAPYDWTLNAPQNGDTGLIVNTNAEISEFVSILKNAAIMGGGAVMVEPQLKFTFGLFNISHNVLPKKFALGAMNGCADCHDASSPFFADHVIFKQPADGGMQMTCDGNDCATGTKRNSGVFSSLCGSHFDQPFENGTVKIDLTSGKAHGDLVANKLDQGTALCYDANRKAGLMWAATASASSVPDIDGDGAPDNTTLMARLSATTAWNRNGAGDPVLLDNAIAVDACGSVCNDDLGNPTACTYAWTVDGTGDALATCAGTITAAPGVHSITVAVTRTSDGSVSTKTLQAAAVAAVTKPSIGTATVTNNTDCTADVDVTSADASTLLVNCGDGQPLVSATFSLGAATAVCDYTASGCAGEAAIIAIVKDADGLASDSVTVDPEYDPAP